MINNGRQCNAASKRLRSFRAKARQSEKKLLSTLHRQSLQMEKSKNAKVKLKRLLSHSTYLIYSIYAQHFIIYFHFDCITTNFITCCHSQWMKGSSKFDKSDDKDEIYYSSLFKRNRMANGTLIHASRHLTKKYVFICKHAFAVYNCLCSMCFYLNARRLTFYSILFSFSLSPCTKHNAEY